MSELTEFELRLFEWIRQSDFESVAWSTRRLLSLSNAQKMRSTKALLL